MFDHHSIKLHRSNLKLITKNDDKYEHMDIFPCKIAEKCVKVKPREEIIEHENLVLSKVPCDKCETNLAPESALKPQNLRYHKDDKITSSRNIIGFMKKQYDPVKQICQCSKHDLKSGNGSDVENHIICHEQDRAKCDTCNIILGDSQRNRSHRSNLRTPGEGVCGFCEPEKEYQAIIAVKCSNVTLIVSVMKAHNTILNVKFAATYKSMKPTLRNTQKNIIGQN